MTRLALHQLTLLDTDPLTFVDIAADAGCTGVCLFSNLPDSLGREFNLPAVTKAMLPDMKRRTAARNMAVEKVDFFVLTDKTPFDKYRHGLELGAELGAKYAITLVYDTDAKRAAESLATLGATAAEFNMTLAIEFMTIAPGCKTIKEAATLIKASGRDNIGISVDALHLERSGGTPADVAATDPKFLVSGQLCDGPLGQSNSYEAEAMDRLPSGEGQFPLKGLIAALPAWAVYDVETPLTKLQLQGVSAIDRARRAVSGARKLLEAKG